MSSALKVLVYFTRKEGASPTDFRIQFEKHMVDLKEIAGDSFPRKHTRIYLERDENGKPGVVYGSEADFGFDGLVIMEFKDRAQKDLFLGRTHMVDELSRFENDPLLPDREKRKVCRIGHIEVTEGI